RREHLRYIRRRLAPRRPRRGLCPSDAIECDDSGLPVLGNGAAEFAAGLKADPRRLIAGLQHHGHPPRRDIRQRFDVGELHTPIALIVELAGPTPPAPPRAQLTAPGR